jgi:NADH-quinone oxidoreductase subunit D
MIERPLDPDDLQGQPRDIPTRHMTINLGPSHPAMHGVVRLVVDMDGETIVKAVPEIGFLHRAFEKSCESCTWNQAVPYTDRLNYVSPVLNNIAFAMAVEKLCGIEDPPRSQWLRVIVGEISRMTDHLTLVAALGLEMGAFTAFLYALEARELLYDRIMEITGARITTNWTRVGGLGMDAPPGWFDRVRQTLPRVVELREEVHAMLSRLRIFLDRTQGVGVISGEEALDWGWTGPCLRASGVPYDIRKEHPYLVYDQVEFDVPIGKNGDTYDRYLMRIEELKQSERIILQGLDKCPEGPIIVDDWRIALPPKPDVYSSIQGVMAHFKLIMEGSQVPAGEAYAYTEGANGELGFYVVSNGAGRPYRVKVRGGGFPILATLPRLIEGRLIADMVPIFDSINMIGGEVEQ